MDCLGFRWLALPLALLLTPCSACDEAMTCTLAGCSDQLNLEVKNPDGVWESGSYVFSVNLDGELVTCPFEVTFAAASTADSLLSC